MANIAPPRFVQVPAPSPEAGIGAALREAYAVPPGRLPAFLARLLACLSRRRPAAPDPVAGAGES